MKNRMVTIVENLLNSTEAQFRIGALVKIENHAADLGKISVEIFLEQALQDTDRRVVEQAKRVKALLESKADELFENPAARSIFQGVPDEVHPEVILKSDEIRKLEEACYDLIAQPTLKVHATLMSDTSGSTDNMIEALGALRLRHSIPVLTRVASDWVFQPQVVTALSSYRTRQAEDALLSITRDPQAPAAAQALAALGVADPEWALPILETHTHHGDPKRRCGAAHGLGNIDLEGASEPLLRLLGDGDENVVVAAITSLSRQSNEGAQSHLTKLALSSDSAKIRSAVAASFRRIQGEEAKNTLQKLLFDPDPRTRANALESLSFYDLTPEEANQHLVPLLRDDTPRIRGNAIVAIYRYRPSQAIENLNQLFNKPDKMLRRAAAWSASQIQSPEVVQSLMTMILTEQDTDVLTSAMRHLSRFARRDSVEVFMRMTRHPRVEVRVAAMRILGRIGSMAQLASLTSFIKQEPSSKVRSAIVSSIAKLAGSNALSLLPRYLNDSDDRVMANAIQGLYESGNLEAISYIKPLLMHPNPRIQANCIVALFSLGELDVIKELTRLLEAKDIKMQSSGAWALGAIGLDLSLSSLSRRFLLKMALKDYHRKMVATEPEARSMARPTSRFKGYNLMTGVTFDLPSGVQGAEALEQGLIAPGLLSGSPATEPSSGSHSTSPRESTEDHVAEILEKSQVVASPLYNRDRVKRTTVDAGEKVDFQQRGLAWEGILKIAGSGAADALDWVTDFLEDNPDDELVKYLKLKLLIDENPDEVIAFINEQILSGPVSYFALLYLSARELKSRGEFDASLKIYLQIFNMQYAAYTELVDLANGAMQDDATSRVSSVVKFLSAQHGLSSNLEAELGSFYFSESHFEKAYPFLYRARFAQPEDSRITLKLAFIMKELKHFTLGKKLIKRIVAREPQESSEYRKALKLYQSLKNLG